MLEHLINHKSVFSSLAKHYQYTFSMITKEGASFDIPDLLSTLGVARGLREQLLSLYNSANNDGKGLYGCVSDKVKLLQEASNQTVLYAYNFVEGTYSLYTSNQELLKLFSNGKRRSIKSENTYSINLSNRLNVALLSQDDLSVKRLNTRTFPKITQNIFLPFEEVYYLCNFVKDLLETANVLYTSTGSYYSINILTLEKYNNDKYFSRNISKVSIDYLKATITAPELGLSNLTKGVSGIHLLSLDNLYLVNDSGSLVQKATIQNTMGTVIKFELQKFLLDNYSQVVDDFSKLLNPLGIITNSFSDLSAALDDYNDISYILSLIQEKYPEIAPSYDDIAKKHSLIASEREEVDKDNLSEKLEEGVYLLNLATNIPSKTRMVFVTNSISILKSVYGDDYITRFESEAGRIRLVKELISENDMSFEEIISFTGLSDFKGETLESFEDKTSSNIAYVPKGLVARSLFGDIVSENTVKGFYVNIDTDKIISVFKVG